MARYVKKQNANKNNDEENVLVLNMSLARKDLSYYYYREKNGCLTFSGYSQLEPGTKYFIEKLALEGKIFDRIVVTCTDEACNRFLVSKPDGEDGEEEYEIQNARRITLDGKPQYDSESSYELYVKRIKDYINKNTRDESSDKEGKEKIKAQIAPDDIGEEYEKNVKSKLTQGRSQLKSMYKNGLESLFKMVHLKDDNMVNIENLQRAILGESGKKINVYMDMQGGQRVFVSLMNGVVTLLEDNRNVVFKNKISVKYSFDNDANEIIDETDSYAIYELISAMRSFSKYGKADMLADFFSKTEKLNDTDGKFLKIIQSISDAIQICAPKYFDDAIDELKRFWDNNEFQNKYLKIVSKDIRDDYGKLLEEHTSLDTISWCYEKGFTQQALTYIEDMMPEKFMGKIEISFADWNAQKLLHDNDLTNLKKFFGAPSYENRKNRILFYNFPKTTSNSDDIYTQEESCKENKDFNKWQGFCDILELWDGDYGVNNKPFANLSEEELNLFFGCEQIKKVIKRAKSQQLSKDVKEAVEFLATIKKTDAASVYDAAMTADEKAFFLAYLDMSIKNCKIYVKNAEKTAEEIAEENGLGEMYDNDKKVMKIIWTLKKNGADLKKECRKWLLVTSSRNEKSYDKDKEDAEFVNDYCGFRLRGEKKGLLVFENYINAKETEVMCKAAGVVDIASGGVKIEEAVFNVSVTIPEKNVERFKALLRLHMALKKERNNSNHGDSSNLRLPLSVVNKAIEIYLKWCSELFETYDK